MIKISKSLGLHWPFERYARGQVIQVLPHGILLLQIGPSGITAIVLIANLLTEKSNLIQDILQGEHFLSSSFCHSTKSMKDLIITHKSVI